MYIWFLPTYSLGQQAIKVIYNVRLSSVNAIIDTFAIKEEEPDDSNDSTLYSFLRRFNSKVTVAL